MERQYLALAITDKTRRATGQPPDPTDKDGRTTIFLGRARP